MESSPEVYAEASSGSRRTWDEAGDGAVGIEDALKQGLFGVLYTVSKEKDEPSLWYVAFWLVLEFLQMFLLTVSPAYGWQFNGDSKVWKVASFIQLNDFLSGRGYTFFLAFMYLMSGLLVLNVCFCVWVAQSFQANRFDQVWPIVFLRWFGSIFFSLLDIASMNLFLTALDCSYFDRPEDVIGYNQEFPDTYCWSMPHAVHATVAALSLMVFATLALMFQMADMELNPVTRNKLAIAHTRTEVTSFLLRLTMTCATTFVNGVKWLAVILCLCTLCIVYMYIRWQPHVYPWVNHVRCGTYAAVAYSALLLAALTYGQQDDVGYGSAVTTGLWAGLAPAAVVGAVTSFFRHRYLTKTVAQRLLNADPGTKSKYIHEFTDARDVEVTARVCRVWINSDTLDKEAMQDAEVILKAGMEQLPNSAYMAIVYASFLKDVQGSYATGYHQLQAAKKRELGFLESFAVFSREQQHIQKASAMDAGEDQATSLVSYVELMRAKRQVLRLHTEALLALRSFWEACLQPQPSFNALARCVQRIEGTVRAAERVYKQVLSRHSTNTQLLRLYAKFLEHIKQDPWGASKWMAEAERLHQQEEEQKDRNAWGGKRLADAALDMPDDTNQALMVVNASSIVQVVSGATKNLLGWSKSELKGRNISAIIPAPYGEEHPRWMKQYTDGEREGLILKQAYELIVVHKDRYVVPIRLRVTRLGGVKDDTVFCGIIKAEPVEPGVGLLWLRPDSGNVIASNLAFAELSGFKSDELMGRPLHELLGAGSEALEALLSDMRAARPRHGALFSLDRSVAPHAAQTVRRSIQLPWNASAPNPSRASMAAPGAAAQERLQLAQTVQVLHKYLDASVEVSVSAHAAGMGSNLMHVLTLKRVPAPPSAIMKRPMLLAVDRKGCISYISNELAQQLGTEAAALQVSGAATLEQIMPQPFAQLHMKYVAEDALRSHRSSVDHQAPSCCAGLSVCLLPKAHRSQAGTAAGHQLQPYRISITRREAKPDQVYHVMQLEQRTMEQALDERRLRLTLSCTGTVVSVDSASPASLFGFDPNTLVGLSVSTFIDAFRAGSQDTSEGEDGEPGAIRAFGLSDRMSLDDERTGDSFEAEATVFNLLIELATRAAQYPGMSYRVGVSQPMEQEELMQFGPMADAVLAQRTRPAVMKVSVRLPETVGISASSFGLSSQQQSRQQQWQQASHALLAAQPSSGSPAVRPSDESAAISLEQQQLLLDRLLNARPHEPADDDEPPVEGQPMSPAGSHGLLAARVAEARSSRMSSQRTTPGNDRSFNGAQGLASLQRPPPVPAAARSGGVPVADDPSNLDSVLRLSSATAPKVAQRANEAMSATAGPVAEGATTDWPTVGTPPLLAAVGPRAMSTSFAAAAPGSQSFRRLPGRFASVGKSGKWNTVAPAPKSLERSETATRRQLNKPKVPSQLGKQGVLAGGAGLPKNVLIEVELWRADLLVGVLEVDGNTGFVVPSGPSDHPLNPAGLLLGLPTAQLYKQPVASFLPPIAGHRVPDLFEEGLGLRPGQPAKRGLLKPSSSLHKRKVLGAVNTMAVPHLGDEAPVEISVQAVRKLGRSDDLFLVMRFANPTCAREDFAEWVLTPPPEPQEGPAITSQESQGLQGRASVGTPTTARNVPGHSGSKQLDGEPWAADGVAVMSDDGTGNPTGSKTSEALGSVSPLLRRGISEDNPGGSSGLGSGVLVAPMAITSMGATTASLLVPRPPPLPATAPSSLIFSAKPAGSRLKSLRMTVNGLIGQAAETGDTSFEASLQPSSGDNDPLSNTMSTPLGVVDASNMQEGGARDLDEGRVATGRSARVSPSLDDMGTFEAASDADVAGGSFQADYNRGKRLRRLVALMSDVQAQELIRRFKSHIWLCLLLLVLVDIIMFIVITLKLKNQQKHIQDLSSATQAASKALDASLMTRKLSLLLNNRTVPSLPGLNNPAHDVPRLLEKMSVCVSELTYLHHGVYLGFPDQSGSLPDDYDLKQLWEKPSLNVTKFYDPSSAPQFEVHRMGAWQLGNMFLTALNDIVKTVPRAYNDSTAGQRFMSWSAPNFVLANGPTSLLEAYTTTLDGLTQEVLGHSSQINAIQLVILSVEGVFLCLSAMSYIWWLSQKLARHRHNVYTVFMYVPQATIRALVQRRISLGEEEAEQAEGHQAGEGQGDDDPPSPQGASVGGPAARGVLFATGSNVSNLYPVPTVAPSGPPISRDIAIMLGDVGAASRAGTHDAPVANGKGSRMRHATVVDDSDSSYEGHCGEARANGRRSSQGGPPCNGSPLASRCASSSLQGSRRNSGLPGGYPGHGVGNTEGGGLRRLTSLLPEALQRLALRQSTAGAADHGGPVEDLEHGVGEASHRRRGAGRLQRQLSFASSAKRQLRRSLQSTLYITAPLCLWCAFIIGINCGGYSLMAGMDNPIATLNTANFVLLRTQAVEFYAQELATSTNATAQATARGILSSQLDWLQEEYNVMLYGASATEDDGAHFALATQGMLVDSGDGAALLYDYTGCLALDPRDCMTEDRPYYEAARQGLNSLMESFTKAMESLIREPEATTNMGAWEYAFQVEAAESDLEGGLVRLSTLYGDHVSGIYSRVELLHALALSVTLVMGLVYLMIIMRHFGRQIQYETKRIAELLSQLPPEVDTLSLLQRALAAGNGRKRHATTKPVTTSGNLKGVIDWNLGRSRSGGEL